jgi:hypothetical protein
MPRQKSYPAPLGRSTQWHFRPLFAAGDLPVIEERVGRQIIPGSGPALIEGVNEATVDYFRAARSEMAGTATDFLAWSDRVAKASAAFLNALGVDPSATWQTVLTPHPLPMRAYAALCSRHGSSLTAARYPDAFPYMDVLEQAVRGAKVAHDVAAHAAEFYAGRKRTPQEAARKGLSAPRFHPASGPRL